MTDKKEGIEADRKHPQGAAERNRAYAEAYNATGDPREGIRAWCGNNKHAIEAAKAVGNWPGHKWR